jgi:YfiH family protein
MTSQNTALWIEADWPAPEHIRAGTSIRTGGYSIEPYNELNLAQHVGDKSDNVEKNRDALIKHLHLKTEPVWLTQAHSSSIICIDTPPINLEADASYTSEKNNVCAVMTADCVPILLCNREGTKVSAVHAGWKGICGGIIENAIETYSEADSLLAWIGPCISSAHYEVGKDVYENCLNHSNLLKIGFEQISADHWYCNLVKIVNILLENKGVGAIYECNLCTYKNDELLFSYRRDGITGRTASMVWME